MDRQKPIVVLPLAKSEAIRIIIPCAVCAAHCQPERSRGISLRDIH